MSLELCNLNEFVFNNIISAGRMAMANVAYDFNDPTVKSKVTPRTVVTRTADQVRWRMGFLHLFRCDY